MSGIAESRLIYSSISCSERVASLGVTGALLFTWLITHCDSQGRMLGKPNVVKQQVVPFLEELTPDEIEKDLGAMARQKLIIWYADSNQRQLIQVKDWWEWQTGLRFIGASHYEPPEGWTDKLTSRGKNGQFTKDAPEPKEAMAS